jgi:ribonuclease D
MGGKETSGLRVSSAGLAGRARGQYSWGMNKTESPFPAPVFITSSAELAALCGRLEAEEFVTVDTEFMRERTYYPELCLVQLAGEHDVAVVDAQAKGIDLSPLGRLFAKTEVTKVFHACRQDVEIFLLMFGAVPEKIFDTQVAAMVAGFGDQVGYDALVSALTGGHIDKAHRFSDWSARPLTAAQVAYAAADVTHLRVVYERLLARLRVDGRMDWVGQEMAALADPATYRVDPERAWERLKVRTGNRRQLAIIQAVAAWREREAQRINIPRQRLVKDEQIPEIAVLAPDDAEGLTRARGISSGFASGKSGVTLLAAIAAAKAIPEADLPRVERVRESQRASPALVALLKVLLNACAEQNNVAARLVASAEEIEALALDESGEHGILSGWRAEMFGNDALRLIRGEIALSAQGKRVKIVPVQG